MLKTRKYDHEGKLAVADSAESLDLICDSCGKKTERVKWVIKENEVIDVCPMCVVNKASDKEETK